MEIIAWHLAGSLATFVAAFLNNRNPHSIELMDGKIGLKDLTPILMLFSWFSLGIIIIVNIISVIRVLILKIVIPKSFIDWFESNKETK